MNDELDTLISAYFDQTLSEEQLGELETWINADPENARRFADAVYLEERLGAELKLKGFTDSAETDDKIVAIPTVTRRSWVTRTAAMAAGLAVAAGLALWWQADTATSPEVSFASVIQTLDVKWAKGYEMAVGERISSGVLRLEMGIIHLEFDSGVEVTLQGPAEFEVKSVEETRLHAGVLTCTVPPGAEGFRVDTRTAQVVDLGTAFGIEQREDGQSEVSVFDGEVEIVTDKDRDKHLLTEGKSVQLGADGSLSEVEFSPEPFEKLWPAASGIAGSTGDFRFAPPWPRRLRLIQSDTEIFVLPEGYRTELEEPCPIDIAGSNSADSPIPAGQRVRSFLLQYNPSNAEPAPRGERIRRIEGSITFARPVLGLIIEGGTLQETDARFSVRSGRGPDAKRGLEGSPPGIADDVSLSEDRHTVTLKLVASGRFSDHVRVIVDAALGEADSH